MTVNPTHYVYLRPSDAGSHDARKVTVGFYDPAGVWHAESDHDTAEKAAARVAYLNGRSDSVQAIERAGMKGIGSMLSRVRSYMRAKWKGFSDHVDKSRSEPDWLD